MPDHTGRRRRRSRLPLGRLAVLASAIVVVGLLFALPEPWRPGAPAPRGAAAAAAPRLDGPAPTVSPGTLPDGTPFAPRIYLDTRTSVGVAARGATVRLVSRSEARVVELRRLAAADHPQFDGFVVSGDVLLWAETVSKGNAAVRTTLWRANWRTSGRPVQITANTGEANFYDGQYDMVVHAGRVFWTSLRPGATTVTEVRSVALDGSSPRVQRLTGEFGLSAWPWAVTGGGRGTPVRMVDLSSGRRVTVSASAAQVLTCAPSWCRVDTLGGTALERIDVRRPDGTGAARVAGSEATPAVSDAVLLDRYVPLITDRGPDGIDGTGLSVYDIVSGRTLLLATDVDNVRGRGGMLWWSTGADDALRWNAVDLRTLG